jgi:dynein light intermediate chain 2
MDANNNAVENIVEEENLDTTTLFLGDSGCGKSTLIQSFLKPNVTKEPKPTFALEYNYARKKIQSGSNQRSVAHIWEIGGDIYEPKLLEIPITAKTISSASIVLCCDLSKPQNCLSSLLRWIDIIKRRIAEIKATNASTISNLREIHKNVYKDHPDAGIVSSSVGIPLFIVLNKYDIFKTLPLSDKRNLLETLRFFAHYYGASIITSSSVDLSLKESFKINCQILAFRLTSKLSFETSSDKPNFIGVSKDNFSDILSSGENAKQYLSSSGCTRECWKLLIEKMKNIFGNHDPSPNEVGPEEDENEFPEPEGNIYIFILFIYYFY